MPKLSDIVWYWRHLKFHILKLITNFSLARKHLNLPHPFSSKIYNTYGKRKVLLKSTIEIRSITVMGSVKAPVFETYRNCKIPEQLLYEIPNAIVWGYYGGAVFDDQHHLIPELSPDKWTDLHTVYTRFRLPKIRYYSGISFLMSDGEGYNNYHHWMFDVLPKLEYLKKSNVELKSIDHFLIYAKYNEYQKETLQKLGITEDKIIFLSKKFQLRLEKLLCPTPVRTFRKVPPFSCDFLRSNFLNNQNNHTNKSQLKVYISRSDAHFRKVINENQLIPILSKFGYNLVSFTGKTVREQIGIIQSSSHIIAPTGSTLTNIVFANKGTKLLELFSPQFVDPFTLSITSQIEVRHHYMIGKDTNFKGAPSDINLKADIFIDVDEFENALRKLDD